MRSSSSSPIEPPPQPQPSGEIIPTTEYLGIGISALGGYCVTRMIFAWLHAPCPVLSLTAT